MTTATLERTVARPAIGDKGQSGPAKKPGKELELFVGRPSPQPAAMGAHLTILSSNTGPHRPAATQSSRRRIKHPPPGKAAEYSGGAALAPMKLVLPKAEVELASLPLKSLSPFAKRPVFAEAHRTTDDFIDGEVIDAELVGEGEIINGVFVEAGSVDDLKRAAANHAVAASIGAEVAVAGAQADVVAQTTHAEMVEVKSQISDEVAVMDGQAAERHDEQKVQEVRDLNESIQKTVQQSTKALTKMNALSAFRSFMQMHQGLLQMMSDMMAAAAQFSAALAESMRSVGR